MKEIVFRQPRRWFILIVGGLYLVTILTLMIVNFDALADIVDDMAAGGAKSTGMIVGAVVFVPIIAIAALATQRIRLRRDADTLTIRVGQRETHVRRADIARFTVNEPRVGVIRLLAADGALIAQLEPRMQEHRAVRDFIDDDAPYVEVERRSAFRGRVSVIIYERPARHAASAR
ncbi:hypothetical protein [Microbacterium sp.]|uniref:hypothetical protein n=1 Tax=Microbacterium sp. TaxID=51671 RepID=UPI0039E65B99